MRCPKCGKVNQSNASRCRYCYYPLKSYSRKSSSNGSDKPIIIAIIALALVAALLFGVYAVDGWNPLPRAGFSGGGGGGGGGGRVIFPSSPFPTPSEIACVNLDDRDSEVELFSFRTDTYDILIGETRTVTFTTEVFADVVLEEGAVKVIDDQNNEVGIMNDSGTAGDATAGDGIYTLTTELTADAQKNTMYYATTGSFTTHGVNIGYYRIFGDTDFTTADIIASKLNELVQPHMNADLTVSTNNLPGVMQSVVQYLNTQKTMGNVSSYTKSGNSVFVRLTSGYMFAYSVAEEGVSAGGSDVRIASYAPFDSLRGSLEPLYDEALDGTAQTISNTFGGYSFSSAGNHDLGEVTLDALKRLSDHKVIIWGGHGGYDSSVNGYGSSLMTGELVNNQTSSSYSADISAERVLTGYSASGRNTYCVTGGFFDKYLGSMDGAFVYLSACHSGHDMTDGISHRYRLAQSFINKGAHAVIANTDTIYSQYTYSMERDIINRMCTANESGVFYTASEALEYAMGIHGSNDGNSSRNSRPMIFPQNSSVASGYRFGNANQGYVSGAVKDIDTNNPIANALVRVYNGDGQWLGSTRTDSGGYYKFSLPAGNYILRISRGHYRSAKVAVDVTGGNTVYNETFLMMKVDAVPPAATGVVTNAINGDTVDGVTLNMRHSWNNFTGSVIHTTSSNADGYYSITYDPGFYTLEYSRNGYITGYKNIIIGVPDSVLQNIAISPEMPDDGAIRIVLSWRNTPKDLDAHLTGPAPDGGRFHLFYPYADRHNSNIYSDYHRLDLDNTDIVTVPGQPETVTIINQIDGVYRYSVHDFSNRGLSGSTALGQSNAVVTVYKGKTIWRTYAVPPDARGSIWTVFEISGNEIKDINRIGNGQADDASKF